jgi:hypothetical protein
MAPRVLIFLLCLAHALRSSRRVQGCCGAMVLSPSWRPLRLLLLLLALSLFLVLRTAAVNGPVRPTLETCLLANDVSYPTCAEYLWIDREEDDARGAGVWRDPSFFDNEAVCNLFTSSKEGRCLLQVVPWLLNETSSAMEDAFWLNAPRNLINALPQHTWPKPRSHSLEREFYDAHDMDKAVRTPGYLHAVSLTVSASGLTGDQLRAAQNVLALVGARRDRYLTAARAFQRIHVDSLLATISARIVASQDIFALMDTAGISVHTRQRDQRAQQTGGRFNCPLVGPISWCFQFRTGSGGCVRSGWKHWGE